MRAAILATLTSTLAFFGLSVPTLAQEATASPTPPQGGSLDFLKVGGKSYLRAYTYDLGASGQRVNNESAIDRIYLTVDARLWESGKLKYVLEGGDLRDTTYRLAPDGKSLETAPGFFAVASKAFYLEVGDLPLGSYLQMGQLDLPWVGYVDGLWGYRVEGTNFMDRSGYLTSTDLGLALGGRYDVASWQVALVNGEGWKSPEAGYHKDLHGRLTLHPFAPLGFKELFVAGAGTLGNYDPDVPVKSVPGFNKTRYLAQLGYQSKGNLLLAADYLILAQDPADKLKSRYPSLGDASLAGQLASASGFSTYGVLNMGLFGLVPALRPLDLVARYDLLDPDVSLASNGTSRLIGGVAVNWNKQLTTLLAYETAAYDSGFLATGNQDPAKGKKPDSKILLTSEVRF